MLFQLIQAQADATVSVYHPMAVRTEHDEVRQRVGLDSSGFGQRDDVVNFNEVLAERPIGLLKAESAPHAVQSMDRYRGTSGFLASFSLRRCIDLLSSFRNGKGRRLTDGVVVGNRRLKSKYEGLKLLIAPTLPFFMCPGEVVSYRRPFAVLIDPTCPTIAEQVIERIPGILEAVPELFGAAAVAHGIVEEIVCSIPRRNADRRRWSISLTG